MSCMVSIGGPWKRCHVCATPTAWRLPWPSAVNFYCCVAPPPCRVQITAGGGGPRGGARPPGYPCVQIMTAAGPHDRNRHGSFLSTCFMNTARNLVMFQASPAYRSGVCDHPCPTSATSAMSPGAASARLDRRRSSAANHANCPDRPPASLCDGCRKLRPRVQGRVPGCPPRGWRGRSACAPNSPLDLRGRAPDAPRPSRPDRGG